MLKNLIIENYALIEKLDLNFDKGFSVITGETGAGKSIMLGALALILGNRADSGVLKDPKKKCFIEGSFAIQDYRLEDFFLKYELDFDMNTIVRREITSLGKSRAFINDTPVNLQVMKELGARLVNVHSQNANITLNDANFQLAVIDNFIGHDQLIDDYREQFKSFRKLEIELENLMEIESKSKADQDYFQFQFEELNKINLISSEQEELEAEIELLKHAEEIKSGLFDSKQLLSDSDANIIGLLSELKNKINLLSDYHPDIAGIADRLKSNLIDLNDLSSDIGAIENQISINPERLEIVNDRLNIIYLLEQKHRVHSITELIIIKNQLDEKLNNIGSIDSKIESLRLKIKKNSTELHNIADTISKARNEAIPEIEKEIIGIIVQLGMPDAQIKISCEELNELSKDGKDKVHYLFNANKGGTLNDVAKIASGGELSRLMLSIKSLISGKKLLPTIIFDEIDLGISGEVASKVGEILLKMANSMQVIAITHLPQIAGKGLSHYMVSKSSDDHSTKTDIKKLDKDERVIEIAKMISGTEISNVAIENAKVLLS